MVVALLNLGLSACGSNGPGSVTGAVYTFELRSAFLVHVSPEDGHTVAEVFLLSDQPWSCKEEAATQIDTFALIAFVGPSEAAVTPGEFTVTGVTGEPSGTYAHVLVSSGGNGLNVGPGHANLEELSFEHAEGSFEVIGGTAHVSGTFDANFCDADFG